MTVALWNNVAWPIDVSGDNPGIVTPIDALLVINELNNPRYSDPRTKELPRRSIDKVEPTLMCRVTAPLLH